MVGYGPPASIHRKPAFLAPLRDDGGQSALRPNRPIAVALIDDRILFGESLAMAINAQFAEFAVTHRTGREVLADPAAALNGVGVVLVCIGRAALPRRPPAGSPLRAVLGCDGHPPVAILADAVSPAMTRTGIALGLRGIVSSTASLRTLVAALRRLHQGATVLPDDASPGTSPGGG